MRRTKIICTLGPATDNENVLRSIMLAGMDGARFNFSHGDHASHLERLEQVIRLREELDLPIPTILDTKGPEIRLKTFKNGKITLQAGQQFTLTSRDVEGDESIVSVTYAGLPQDVSSGSHILIDDGLIDMEVVTLTDTDIICRVINGGVVSNRKGVNVPNTELSMDYISKQDYDDIVFGIENHFDYIAASFVRTADDILAIRRILKEHDCGWMKIIAKIENKQGINNLDEILQVANGIMVARGDMGVEIAMEELPPLQKEMIRKACANGKVVVTATQMLDSMMKNPRPTRAEITDVANAIYDGTSAIMLSGETAAGAYPVEAVKTMVRIAERTEQDIDYASRLRGALVVSSPYVTDAISHATCTTAMDLNAAAIITVTKGGRTARMISKFHPTCPIICCTTDEHVYRQMNLYWGIKPIIIEEKFSTDDLFNHAVECAMGTGMLHDGDITVMTAGVPLGISGTTNLMKVHVIGDILATGQGFGKDTIQAHIRVCMTEDEVHSRLKDGEILVVHNTTDTMVPYIRKASGLIVESAESLSHAKTLALALDIPLLANCENATHRLKTGVLVTLNPKQGTVQYTSN